MREREKWAEREREREKETEFYMRYNSSNKYTMVCQPVRESNPLALASGLV